MKLTFLFLLADDLSYTDIAPYGSEVSTPALSKLAQKGVRFCLLTAANCAPARAAADDRRAPSGWRAQHS